MDLPDLASGEDCSLLPRLCPMAVSSGEGAETDSWIRCLHEMEEAEDKRRGRQLSCIDCFHKVTNPTCGSPILMA